jgi:hypothetical protein
MCGTGSIFLESGIGKSSRLESRLTREISENDRGTGPPASSDTRSKMQDPPARPGRSQEVGCGAHASTHPIQDSRIKMQDPPTHPRSQPRSHEDTKTAHPTRKTQSRPPNHGPGPKSGSCRERPSHRPTCSEHVGSALLLPELRGRVTQWQPLCVSATLRLCDSASLRLCVSAMNGWVGGTFSVETLERCVSDGDGDFCIPYRGMV